MKIKRVMIAATGSGRGKTVVTCALLQALKDHGWKVASYKCGPDYIDPMFHEKIIDVPVFTLIRDYGKLKQILGSLCKRIKQ